MRFALEETVFLSVLLNLKHVYSVPLSCDVDLNLRERCKGSTPGINKYQCELM